MHTDTNYTQVNLDLPGEEQVTEPSQTWREWANEKITWIKNNPVDATILASLGGIVLTGSAITLSTSLATACDNAAIMYDKYSRDFEAGLNSLAGRVNDVLGNTRNAMKYIESLEKSTDFKTQGGNRYFQIGTTNVYVKSVSDVNYENLMKGYSNGIDEKLDDFRQRIDSVDDVTLNSVNELITNSEFNSAIHDLNYTVKLLLNAHKGDAESVRMMRAFILDELNTKLANITLPGDGVKFSDNPLKELFMPDGVTNKTDTHRLLEEAFAYKIDTGVIGADLAYKNYIRSLGSDFALDLEKKQPIDSSKFKQESINNSFNEAVNTYGTALKGFSKDLELVFKSNTAQTKSELLSSTESIFWLDTVKETYLTNFTRLHTLDGSDPKLAEYAELVRDKVLGNFRDNFGNLTVGKFNDITLGFDDIIDTLYQTPTQLFGIYKDNIKASANTNDSNKHIFKNIEENPTGEGSGYYADLKDASAYSSYETFSNKFDVYFNDRLTAVLKHQVSNNNDTEAVLRNLPKNITTIIDTLGANAVHSDLLNPKSALILDLRVNALEYTLKKIDGYKIGLDGSKIEELKTALKNELAAAKSEYKHSASNPYAKPYPGPCGSPTIPIVSGVLTGVSAAIGLGAIYYRVSSANKPEPTNTDVELKDFTSTILALREGATLTDAQKADLEKGQIFQLMPNEGEQAQEYMDRMYTTLMDIAVNERKENGDNSHTLMNFLRNMHSTLIPLNKIACNKPVGSVVVTMAYKIADSVFKTKLTAKQADKLGEEHMQVDVAKFIEANPDLSVFKGFWKGAYDYGEEGAKKVIAYIIDKTA